MNPPVFGPPALRWAGAKTDTLADSMCVHSAQCCWRGLAAAPFTRLQKKHRKNTRVAAAPTVALLCFAGLCGAELSEHSSFTANAVCPSGERGGGFLSCGMLNVNASGELVLSPAGQLGCGNLCDKTYQHHNKFSDGRTTLPRRNTGVYSQHYVTMTRRQSFTFTREDLLSRLKLQKLIVAVK